MRSVKKGASALAGALVAFAAFAMPLRAQTIALNVGTAAQLQVLPGATVAIPIQADVTGGGLIASLTSGITWNTLTGGFAFSSLIAGVWPTFTPTTTNAVSGSISFVTSNGVNLPATSSLAVASFTASIPPVGVERGTRIFLAPTSAANAAAGSVLAALRPRYLDVCISEGKWGDVNNDNNVNIVDAQQMARKSVGLSVANPTTTTLRGDVNAVGGAEPNIVDAQQTVRFSVGLSAAARLGTGTFTVPAVATHNLNPNTAQSIAVGGTLQITNTPRDAASVDLTGCAGSTWETSNAAIATVNASGLVTGVSGGGPVTITSRSTVNTAITQTVQVTVTGAADPCGPAAATAVVVGQTINGTLANTDCPLAGGKFADFYSLTVAQSSTIQIAMTGNPLNTFLSLADANNTTPTIVDNDTFTPIYASAGFHARINRTIAAGTYIIRATSSGAGATGAYTLRVCDAAPTLITAGQTLGGTIATTDCDLGDGTLFDRWQFTLAAGANVSVTMASTAVTPYMFLLNSAESTSPPLGEVGAVGSANISGALSAGTYVVWTNTNSVGQLGAYTLNFTAVVDACTVSNPITPAQTVNGTIQAGDCLLTDGTRIDRWQLVLAAPTALRIDLTSAAFDAFVFMQNSSGLTVASGDDGAGGTDARIEGTFPAGTYYINANTFVAGATGAYTLTTSALPAGTVNLKIDAAYIVQASQRLNGSVPLVASRDGAIRIFVRADQANTATPSVRYRIYNSAGTVVRSQTITAPGSSTPTVLAEGSLGQSWFFTVLASEITVGMRLEATVDPAGSIPESNETDNNWPPGSASTFATARALDVRTMPTLHMTLVPINQGANLSILTAGNVDQYLDFTRRVWPLSTVTPVLHAPYASTTPAVLSDGTNWSAVLNEIRTLRLTEGTPGRHYYGVLHASYSSGVAGLGEFGVPNAIGWGHLPSASPVTAHELGHNFDRRHAPCGGPAGPDPAYPYANAIIGAFGFDVGALTIKSSSMPDLMSYCSPEWISDYTYMSAMSFIFGHPTAPSIQQAVPSVVVWGRVENGELILEPAFEAIAPPTPTRASGPYRIIGTNGTGAQVLNVAFMPDEIADARRTAYNFTFVIPKSSLGAGELAGLQLTGPAGGAVSRVASASPPNAAIIQSTVAATRVATDRVEVRWNASQYPLAVVRSALTGEILSLARGGSVTVQSSESNLDITLSDGVRSAVHRKTTQ